MLSRILFIYLVLCLSACTEKPNAEMKQANQSTETPMVEPPMVGGDSDEHGCKGSAGYSWSIVKNECIQIFNSGIRLNPQAGHLEKTMSAFAVFKSDTEDNQAEIFLPNEKKSILLAKVGKENAGEWKNESYILTHYKGMYMLEDSKKTLLYQGAAVK
jgi:hypothetical protein